MVGAEIRGDRTGRVWRYHPTIDHLEAPGSGQRYKVTATDDGSLACLHRCQKGGLWEDDVDRLRHALAIVSLPEVAAAPTIRRLLDIHDAEGTTGRFAYPGSLAAIWEWADVSLDDFLHGPDEGHVGRSGVAAPG